MRNWRHSRTIRPSHLSTISMSISVSVSVSVSRTNPHTSSRFRTKNLYFITINVIRFTKNTSYVNLLNYWVSLTKSLSNYCSNKT